MGRIVLKKHTTKKPGGQSFFLNFGDFSMLRFAEIVMRIVTKCCDLYSPLIHQRFWEFLENFGRELFFTFPTPPEKTLQFDFCSPFCAT